MASLVGSWQFVGAENLDGYMQAAGKICSLIVLIYVFFYFHFDMVFCQFYLFQSFSQNV